MSSNTISLSSGASGNNGGVNGQNKAFSSGIERNKNSNKYSPIQGGSSGSQNLGGKIPAKPKVPVLNKDMRKIDGRWVKRIK